jgi:hypothetical protein
VLQANVALTPARCGLTHYRAISDAGNLAILEQHCPDYILGLIKIKKRSPQLRQELIVGVERRFTFHKRLRHATGMDALRTSPFLLLILAFLRLLPSAT